MDIQLGLIESRFADIIWNNEPVSSSELVIMAAKEFGWKRTTTHTVIKRLCDKELFCNENGIVKALLSREDFYSRLSKQYVKTSFGGSLPNFIASFTNGLRLSSKEAETIRKMIDDAEDK